MCIFKYYQPKIRLNCKTKGIIRLGLMPLKNWRNMVKIIFFDIDNTIVSHQDFTISTKTLKSLKKLKEDGIKIVACTGRNEAELKNMQVTSLIDFDALILMSGQLVKIKFEIIYKNFFDKAFIKKVISDSEKHDLNCIFYTEKKIYASSKQATDCYYRSNGCFIQTDYNLDELQETECFEFSLFSNEKLKMLNLEMEKIEIIKYFDDCFDIFPFDGGKDKGIKILLDYYGIDKVDTMAFGDSMNDYTMFKAVGTSIAMANSDEKVKYITDYVTSDVNEDGIYNALVHYKLI